MSARVYVSSKLKHRQMWIDSKLNIVSSWIHSPELPAEECSAMWDRYADEVRTSDCLILYVEPEDVLKGCLLELGFAFTCQIPIIIIWQGSVKELAIKVGTIVHHRSVRIVPDITSAIEIMKQSGK